MKIDIPSVPTEKIRSALNLCVELGYISVEQKSSVLSIINPSSAEKACEKRNKKPLWERFGKDLADLLESYDVDINLGRYQKADVTFYSDPGNNWGVPLDYVIDHKLIRRWPGIVSRQKKASKRDFRHITEFLIAMKEAELDRQLREDEKLAIINEHNRKHPNQQNQN